MQTLAQELLNRRAETPDEVVVVDPAGEHTIDEIMTAATRIAGMIAEHSENAPTAVVQADNTWQTVALVAAVGLRGGLVAVISPHATESEFGLAIEDIDPDVVIAADRVLEHWGVDAASFAARLGVEGGRSVLAASEIRGVERWGDGRVIAMTSGSTGRPKCVVQSEAALRYAARSTVDANGLVRGDRIGAFVPLSSVAAICFGMYLPMYLGGTMVCIEKWTPAAGLAAMHDERVAWTMLVPTMALQLSVVAGADQPLNEMKAMTVGGGPMNIRALHDAEVKLGTTFLRVFGMSECLGHTTPLPTDAVAVRLGRDGRPFPGTTVRAVDEDGKVTAPGTVGDAQVRGPSMFVGYARGGVPDPPELTADGFLPTGDLVEIDEDGYLLVMGRQKQIIIRGGRNIDINEVESAVAALPGVVQACIVPVPDDMLGERAAALIVSDGQPVTLESVTGQLDEAGFPRFKWPEYVFEVADLPQNRVGKLSRPDAVEIARRLAQP